MKKISFLIIFLIFALFNTVFAVDEIDMNLAVDTNTSTSAENTVVEEDNTTINSNNSNENTSSNENTTNNTPVNTTTNPNSTTVSSLSNMPESELGLTNILNIALVVIGVLLLLLSIAILIRLK